MKLSINTLRSEYQDKSLTPEKVVEQILVECEKLGDHNIWITLLDKEQIQPYLEKLKGQTPESLPLYGIPFAIKDNIDLAGVPTTAACPEYRYVPQQHAFVVEQLINAGAIPIGKTNMDQFATGLVGTRSPEPWGPCRNAFTIKSISLVVPVPVRLWPSLLGWSVFLSARIPPDRAVCQP